RIVSDHQDALSFFGVRVASLSFSGIRLSSFSVEQVGKSTRLHNGARFCGAARLGRVRTGLALSGKIREFI
ncbi:MAG: hypothetical protein WD772_01360, partial [Pseudohongiellaceae bacterium]